MAKDEIFRELQAAILVQFGIFWQANVDNWDEDIPFDEPNLLIDFGLFLLGDRQP